jgi:hypothetical protein
VGSPGSGEDSSLFTDPMSSGGKWRQMVSLLEACAHHGWTLNRLRNGRAKTAAEMTTEMVQ